jgi:hypothetical protein
MKVEMARDSNGPNPKHLYKDSKKKKRIRGTNNTQTRLEPGRCCQTIGYRIYEAQGRKISKPVNNVALNIHSIILLFGCQIQS